MDEVGLRRLIAQQNECEWLDYKEAYPTGLRFHTAKTNKKEFDEGRYTLLKDLLCLANSSCDAHKRYLIVGVDETPQGNVIKGHTHDLNIDHLQNWNEHTFDPPLRFQLQKFFLPEGQVDVFTIMPRSTPPHLPKFDCSPMHKGQVWTRLDATNCVAVGEVWRIHTQPIPPLLSAQLLLNDGRKARGITTADWEKQQNTLARKKARAAFDEGMSLLEEAVRQPGVLSQQGVQEPEEAVGLRPLMDQLVVALTHTKTNEPVQERWYRAAYPEGRQDSVRRFARKLKRTVDEQWLNPPQLSTKLPLLFDIHWESPAQYIVGHTGWLEALEHLHAAHQEWSEEEHRWREWRLNQPIVLRVENEGPSVAEDITVVLRVEAPHRFVLTDPTEKKETWLGTKTVKKPRTEKDFSVGDTAQELRVTLKRLLVNDFAILQHAVLKRTSVEPCRITCQMMSPAWSKGKTEELWFT